VTAPDRWEHFAHGADVGVRGVGATREAAFEQAALALTAVIAAPSAVRDSVPTAIHLRAPDDTLLFVDWINELVYEMATGHRLFGRFDVTIRDEPGSCRLDGTAYGEPVDRLRHQPAVEVKGATHTELRVAREPGGGWIAQCVVDV